MAYTIKDIAQRAGVSKTTVSRYIKDERDKISQSTQKKISKVIDELDYRPNQIAVGLARKQLPMVGVVVSDISNPFSSVVMKGIFDACTERDITTSFAISDGSPSRERANIRDFKAFSIDQLIIQTCGENEEFLCELDPKKTVIIDRPLKTKKFYTVTSDNYESTYKAIKYLQSNGCFPVAFVTSEIGAITTRAIRFQGYMDAVKGFQEPIVITFDSEKEAVEHFDQVFKGEMQPKGIFASNGEVMKSFLRFAKTRGIRIGHDVGVISFEDWDWMDFVTPALTAVRQDSYEMGYIAAKELVNGRKLEDNTAETEIQSELVIRDSARLQ